MEEFDQSDAFIPSLYTPTSLLPVARHKESLLYLIDSYQVTIVVGQTGSGKTTQIPQFLEQAGWCEGGKVIAVTQVRERLDSLMNLANVSCHSQGGLLLQQLQAGLRRK